ncbi:hypothetical protein MHYP_G00196600 [Metynnis hypsauchen]
MDKGGFCDVEIFSGLGPDANEVQLVRVTVLPAEGSPALKCVQLARADIFTFTPLALLLAGRAAQRSRAGERRESGDRCGGQTAAVLCFRFNSLSAPFLQFSQI